MSFSPQYKLSELAIMAGFNDVDELAKYANTSRQNLNNWNNAENKQAFLKTVIQGAQVNKSNEIRRQAQQRESQRN
ncbi:MULTISPECIES: hypothetical protein [Vibrio]|uniref:hypothetical protein n=1 Tax=Vibrio TaxID=662 RepID=UPI001E5B9A88|nr:hypothetical protein [Vibrio lentus]MCC4838107.1 hypothetical protein [Vibrio lentus]